MSWTSWDADKIVNTVDKQGVKALTEAAEAIGAISDQQVPLDEGTLLTSKTIKMAPFGVEPDRRQVSISYGGGVNTGFQRVPYAVRWHEETANFQHGRKSNYLRDPVNQNGTELLLKSLRKNIKL